MGALAFCFENKEVTMYLDEAKVRYEMYRAGLKVQDLAHIAGVSRCNLSSILNGKRCRESTIVRIAVALNVAVESITR